jgi:CRISPR/Cas system-associated endoribonuclease Cas2
VHRLSETGRKALDNKNACEKGFKRAQISKLHHHLTSTKIEFVAMWDNREQFNKKKRDTIAIKSFEKKCFD